MSGIRYERRSWLASKTAESLLLAAAPRRTPHITSFDQRTTDHRQALSQ